MRVIIRGMVKARPDGTVWWHSLTCGGIFNWYISYNPSWVSRHTDGKIQKENSWLSNLILPSYYIHEWVTRTTRFPSHTYGEWSSRQPIRRGWSLPKSATCKQTWRIHKSWWQSSCKAVSDRDNTHSQMKLAETIDVNFPESLFSLGLNIS